MAMQKVSFLLQTIPFLSNCVKANNFYSWGFASKYLKFLNLLLLLCIEKKIVAKPLNNNSLFALLDNFKCFFLSANLSFTLREARVGREGKLQNGGQSNLRLILTWKWQHTHPTYQVRELNLGHCLSHHFSMDFALGIIMIILLSLRLCNQW